MKYRFLREALVEYEDAIEYYERARAGLGSAFVDEVERAIALVLQFPGIGSPVATTPPELQVRRRLVRRFDFEIDYVVGRDEIVVIAIFHCKRRPGYWRARLAKLR